MCVFNVFCFALAKSVVNGVLFDIKFFVSDSGVVIASSYFDDLFKTSLTAQD